MPGEAREILRMHRCPECEYDLRGLPAAHRCPECGFEYDESMFDLAGWWEAGSERRSGIRGSEWMIVVGLIVAVAVVLRLWFTISRWIVYPAIMLVAIVASTLSYSRRLRGAPEIQIIALPDNLVLRRPGAKRGTRFHWTAFRAAVMARIRTPAGARWNLTLKRRWPTAAFRASVGVLIAGDRRTAAVVRNEIRRRIRVANERYGTLKRPCPARRARF